MSRLANLTQSALTEKSIGRFLEKVDRKKPDQCWPWKGSKTVAGYGRVRIHGVAYSSHRVAYVIANKCDLGDQQVRITCGNRLCCNPSHLATSTEKIAAKKKQRKKPLRRRRDNFPLTAHKGSGQWCKKIRGKTYYFGPLADPDAALQKYLDEKDELHRGHTPTARTGAPTLRTLVNHFLTERQNLVESGELAQRTWNDYRSVGATLLEFFGKDTLVESVTPEWLMDYRASLSKDVSPTTLGNRVRMSRMILIHAYDAGLVDKPVRLGKRFSQPKASVIRRHRKERGPLMFESCELRDLIAAAKPAMRAMVLLGINCGLGNADIGLLSLNAIDFESKWLNYPRVKNHADRESPLWDETIDAVKEAIEVRPDPIFDEDDCRMFLTNRGKRWYRDAKVNPLSQAFKKLCRECGHDKLGRSFYSLRRTFETVGGDYGDQIAVDYVMGHSDQSMAAVYRQKVFRGRLIRVTDHVHHWLFGDV